MSQQSTVNTLRPVYNLVELELDNYEENELVLDTIYDLKLFLKILIIVLAIELQNKKTLELNQRLLTFYLQNHLQINGLTEHVHGNTGHASKTESRVFLDFNIISTVKQFLIQYGIIHGLSSPLRHHDDSGVFIYLPTSQSYTSVYTEYKKVFYLIHDQSEKIISYSTFKRLWREMVPNLRFQPPASDLCEICTLFKANLLAAKKDIDEYNKVQ
ncbi:14138_t:CDS:2, partial [Dentiscutata erythropus]